MKQIAIFVCALLVAGSVSAQIDSDYEAFKKRAQSQYAAFADKARKDYNEFRRKANEDYARFMEQAWEEMSVFKGEEPPKEPKPVRPPVVAPDKMPPSQPEPLPTPEVVPVHAPVPPPEIKPDEMIDELPKPAPEDPTIGMTFYGTKCPLHTDASKHIVVKTVSEKAAAQAWKQLSDGRYDVLLRDCLSLRGSLKLGDWGFIELTRQVAVKAMGKEGNEAVLLHGWLLSQSGIEIRLAKTDGHFVVMVPFDEELYKYQYVVNKGKRYYVLNDKSEGTLSSYNMSFPKAHIASLRLPQLPQLAMSRTAQRNFEAEHFSTMKASVSVNKHLMAFFENYPQSNGYSYFVNASLSSELKEQLYPTLRQQLEGKSKKKQVQMLLDFVQTAFEYKTDDDQFGRERSFFGDESFFHPYNDCEDRSILFSILVRELVGLDVVLVILPGHMATAVQFDTEVPGSYYSVEGKNYTMCDPTYIGAGIGKAMPQFQNTKARFVMLKSDN